MPKEVTAFVSGTAVDLREERQAVIEVLQSLGIRTNTMEQFGARAAKPIETCLAEVRSSDIIILIVGHRYGTLVPGSKPSISFSHAEYLEAIISGIRPLVYIRSDDVEILPAYVETNPRKRSALAKWKRVLRESHTVREFRDAGRLAASVAVDIPMALRDIKKEGRHPRKAHKHSVPPQAQTSSVPPLQGKGENTRWLHHISLPVRDLKQSMAFYQNIIGLELAPRLQFPFPGAWFQIAEDQQVHLVVNREGAFRVGRTIEPRDTHFAIRVGDWREAVARLLRNRQPFVIDPYQLGYLQLYVADPDGHIVELNAPDIAGTES